MFKFLKLHLSTACQSSVHVHNIYYYLDINVATLWKWSRGRAHMPAGVFVCQCYQLTSDNIDVGKFSLNLNLKFVTQALECWKFHLIGVLALQFSEF